LLKIILKPL